MGLFDYFLRDTFGLPFGLSLIIRSDYALYNGEPQPIFFELCDIGFTASIAGLVSPLVTAA